MEWWTLNGHTPFHAPHEPVLQTNALGLGLDDPRAFGHPGNDEAKPLVHKLLYDPENPKWYEIVLVNYEGQQHPWHIHGFEAHVVGYGYFCTQFPGWKMTAFNRVFRNGDGKVADKYKKFQTFVNNQSGVPVHMPLTFGVVGEPDVAATKNGGVDTRTADWSVNALSILQVAKNGEGAQPPCVQMKRGGKEEEEEKEKNGATDARPCSEHVRQKNCEVASRCSWFSCMPTVSAQKAEVEARAKLANPDDAKEVADFESKLCQSRTTRETCERGYAGPGDCKWYGDEVEAPHLHEANQYEFKYNPKNHVNLMFGRNHSKTLPEKDEPAESYVVGDTFTVPPKGFVVMRVKADNPGAWFMHCHMEWHLGAGMGLMLSVEDKDGKYGLPPPPQDFKMCGKASNWGKGGPAAREGEVGGGGGGGKGDGGSSHAIPLGLVDEGSEDGPTHGRRKKQQQQQQQQQLGPDASFVILPFSISSGNVLSFVLGLVTIALYSLSRRAWAQWEFRARLKQQPATTLLELSSLFRQRKAAYEQEVMELVLPQQQPQEQQ